MFVDVTFPLKLKPLTYCLPEAINPTDLEGSVVLAPVGKQDLYGLITNVSSTAAANLKTIKPLKAILCKLGSSKYLSFFNWLSKYYITPAGITLKTMQFDELIEAMKLIDFKIPSDLKPHANNYSAVLKVMPNIYSIKEDLLEDALKDNLKKVVLAPDKSYLSHIYEVLKAALNPSEIAIFYSKLPKNQRLQSLLQILSGNFKIALGMRSLILLPFKEINHITVINEQSPSYKAEGLLRYNCRDASVMRAYIEKCPISLLTTMPSIESYYNTLKGKYKLVLESTKPVQMPKVKIVQLSKTDTAVSKPILQALTTTYQKGGSCLLVINQKGYSLLRCNDCGQLLLCSSCSMPYTFDKSANNYYCSSCKQRVAVHDQCPYCQGLSLKAWGVGLQRVNEEIKQVFKAQTQVIYKGLKSQDENARFCIATKYAMTKAFEHKYDIAVMINIDLNFRHADYRVYEKTFADFIDVANMLKPDGEIYIQTYHLELAIWRFMKTYDIKGFCEYELRQRQALKYPPFSKIALLYFEAKQDLGELIAQIVKKYQCLNQEVLGPVLLTAKGKYSYQVLVKAKDSKSLQEITNRIINTFKDVKGLKIIADVDPIRS